MSVPFDLAQATVTGEPVVVLDDVMQALNMPLNIITTGAGLITVSRSGHLAYAAGGIYPVRRNEIVRVSLDGTEEALGPELQGYAQVRVSPDGSRLLSMSNTAEGGSTLLIHDLARGVSSLLDVGGFFDSSPRFSPDGLSMVFASDRGNITRSVHRMPLDGSVPPERLVTRDVETTPSSWSSTGVIAYVEDNRDIWMLPPDGEPVPFLATDAIETHPSFSPDGQWVAYVSNATGREEVYVRPYPGPGAALQISGNGGAEPAWSPDGRRLYYGSPGAQGTLLLKFVDITIDTDRVPSPMQAGREAVLIEPWPYHSTATTRSFDVAPDGSFIAIKPVDRDAANAGESNPAVYRRLYAVSELQIVLNFAEELRARQAAVAQ
jgi:dipeptidyl aminopeptidase/acylaminoacyl peptidase